jgi:hypothetical protein
LAELEKNFGFCLFQACSRERYDGLSTSPPSVSYALQNTLAMISLHEVAGLSPSDYDYSQAQPDLQWASSAESGVSQPLGYKCGKIFRYDIVDAADNVQLNADGSLKSGTFEKLVEKLTSKASGA